MFYTGQKVVCLGINYPPNVGWEYIPNKPVPQGIYHIRGYAKAVGKDDAPRVFLQELLNPEVTWTQHPPLGTIREEGSFPEHGFRALDGRTTDISVFTEILDKVKTGEKV